MATFANGLELDTRPPELVSGQRAGTGRRQTRPGSFCPLVRPTPDTRRRGRCAKGASATAETTHSGCTVLDCSMSYDGSHRVGP
jgi:hypothetical protein